MGRLEVNYHIPAITHAELVDAKAENLALKEPRDISFQVLLEREMANEKEKTSKADPQN